MKRPLRFVALLIYRLFERLEREAFELRNAQFLFREQGARIEQGVVIRPFGTGQLGFGPGLKIQLKERAVIGHGTVIKGSGSFEMGAASFCGPSCVIGCNEAIIIGRDVMIADHVSIRDTDHTFVRTDIPMNQQGIVTAPVRIGDDVWIGYGASILKGVTIGNGAIVASGAVVNTHVAPFSIVGGVPARVISTRTPYSRPINGSVITEEPYA